MQGKLQRSGRDGRRHEKRAIALGTIKQVIEDGIEHDPHNRFLVDQETNGNADKGESMTKVGGAISRVSFQNTNGIQDPRWIIRELTGRIG